MLAFVSVSQKSVLLTKTAMKHMKEEGVKLFHTPKRHCYQLWIITKKYKMKFDELRI